MNCPNCITPWKCNGPHLEKINDSHYKCEYGYFLRNPSPFIDEWAFIPLEKSFKASILQEIIDTLNYFNTKMI